jgi:hypothetical protein
MMARYVALLVLAVSLALAAGSIMWGDTVIWGS